MREPSSNSFCTQPIKVMSKWICRTAGLCLLPQKNTPLPWQDLLTLWRIGDKKGKGLGATQQMKWQVFRRGVGHKAITVVCCLGRRTDKNPFYYSMTYLSPGKDRTSASLPMTLHSSYYGMFRAHPWETQPCLSKSAFEWITGKIRHYSALFSTP